VVSVGLGAPLTEAQPASDKVPAVLPDKTPPLALGQDKSEAAKKELAALQGMWKLRTHEEQGKLLPHDDTQFVTIADDKITWEQHGEVVMQGTIELEAGRSPKHLNYQFTSGRSDQVIYIRVGDYLIQCGRRDGKTRPSEFATATANGGEYLIVLKRVK
jgi:uncharacterized protein (TIGR03067 family)